MRAKRVGVYTITNILDNKVYVGSSTELARRWKRHQTALLQNKHHAKRLQEVVNLHGLSVLVFSVVNELTKADDETELAFKTRLLNEEQALLDSLQASNPEFGYNTAAFAGKPWLRCTGEKSPTYRRAVSEETRAKLSSAHTGKNASEETKQRLSAAWQKRRIEQPTTEATKAKISAALKTRKHSTESKNKQSEQKKLWWQQNPMTEERRAKFSESHRNQKPSTKALEAAAKWRKHRPPTTDTTKQKISAVHKGKTISEEQRKKIRESLLGKKRGPMSEEHKKRISESRKGKPLSEEHKINLCKAQRARWNTRKQEEGHHDKAN